MNAFTLGIVTFVIWISAKGELKNYVELTRTRDIDNNGSSNSVSNAHNLPELPPIGGNNSVPMQY